MIMQTEFELHKSDIAIALRPIFELLEHRQTVLSGIEWTQFARKTLESVVANPSQYISQGHLPDDLTHRAIYEIFADFFQQHRHFRGMS